MPFAASMAFLLTSFSRPLMGIDSTGCYSSRPAADSESGQLRRLTGCSAIMTAYMQQPKRAHALQKWRGIALRAWPMRKKQYPRRITPAEAHRLLPFVRLRDLKTAAVCVMPTMPTGRRTEAAAAQATCWSLSPWLMSRAGRGASTMSGPDGRHDRAGQSWPCRSRLHFAKGRVILSMARKRQGVAWKR